ncbi:MAG: lpxB, partial [Rickettsiaceae bacterium]|nr:lpxB [Rickettsiaceae bacterium]
MKIYIIAGEASGDIYGAKLIESLRKLSPSPIEFSGIGGDKMAAAGLTSLFPMSEISIMGFMEVIPHIPNTLRRIRQTVEDIKNIRPDVVITIDSPGFCCRVVEKLKEKSVPTILAHTPHDMQFTAWEDAGSPSRSREVFLHSRLTGTPHKNLKGGFLRGAVLKMINFTTALSKTEIRKNPIFLHYVAPTVWAYKPKRAEKFARLFDHLLAILPF